MLPPLRIGIIGDRKPENLHHLGTEQALRDAADYFDIGLEMNWIPTVSLDSNPVTTLRNYDGFLCAPGSPYKSMEGALNGVKFARESSLPFLGTCGGFQHMVIEFARNVMKVQDAQHSEDHPKSPRPFITPLACSLLGKSEKVMILPHTRASEIYRANETQEQYHCSFGVNPTYRHSIEENGLRTSGLDVNGEIRISELPKLPFFIGTLFLPQMSSRPNQPHPLLLELLKSSISQKQIKKAKPRP